jgi:serine protease AprX
MRFCGSSRFSALAVLVLTSAALSVPYAAIADSHRQTAYVDARLLASAERNPDGLLRVIVQGDEETSTAEVARVVAKSLDDDRSSRDALRGRFASINGVAATLTGEQLRDLADGDSIEAITSDDPMVASAASDNGWIRETGAFAARPAPSPNAGVPTIALVDSGIDLQGMLGSRVVGQISITQLTPNASGDGRGHGTFVAGVAAEAAPRARLVGLDVMDDSGKAMTSDVIAAADWILQNKERYGIRVANFSLHAARPSSFRTDPLDRAVERLWLAGVVVVASAGNYRSGTGPSGVPFAPANDPFVITVGATDLGSRPGGADDSAAPWSAYGRTRDGFLKPELGAPGRGLVARVPADSTMAAEHPERVLGRGFMRMSGTSLAAPIVAAAAAHVLAVHPEWTPDEVKGALMATARPAGLAETDSVGMGQVDVRAAQRVTNPPNPNRALARFLVADEADGPVPVFDAASWDSAAEDDASWDSASWSDASWTDASWGDASWAGASRTDASWADASWGNASWVD